jgi:hypothetical protein
MARIQVDGHSNFDLLCWRIVAIIGAIAGGAFVAYAGSKYLAVPIILGALFLCLEVYALKMRSRAAWLDETADGYEYTHRRSTPPTTRCPRLAPRLTRRHGTIGD